MARRSPSSARPTSSGTDSLLTLTTSGSCGDRAPHCRDDLFGRGARTEDRSDTGVFEDGNVGLGDDAADDQRDVEVGVVERSAGGEGGERATVLVECNDGLALGLYPGCPAEVYVDVLVARWRELASSIGERAHH